MPVSMTREAFIAAYVGRSGITWEWLSKHRHVVPCDWATMPSLYKERNLTHAQ